MGVHTMTTGTSSRPERIEETLRIEALKKRQAENDRKKAEQRTHQVASDGLASSLSR